MQKHLALPQAFADIGIDIPLLKALAKVNYVEPSEIQRALIPPALEGRDILGQARTGTGKTAAFSLPILQQLDPKGGLQALCLAPTRELAVQVAGEVSRLAEFTGLHVVPVYGGAKMATQEHQLGRRPHFVVGTPGRVMDFMRRGVLNIADLRFVVLDEVDRMLDIGFREDIKAILGRVTAPHQTILVSATLDDEIKRLAMRYMNDPLEVNVSKDRITVDEIDQSYVTVDSPEKFRVLRLILEQEDPPICIVFCNTKAMVRKLAQKLHESGVDASPIEGDLDQRKRERVMAQFRKHQLRVLVATDLAARGIDVSEISHIINYDLPPDPQVYVHRIGRTARMGARGVAISLVPRDQGKELTNIEMLTNKLISERQVAGFVPRAPQRRAPEPESTGPVVSARFAQPAAAPAAEAGPKAPRRTLGGKFKPSRRRRL
jgi:ATP-dependent RNA helicase DeaD